MLLYNSIFYVHDNIIYCITRIFVCITILCRWKKTLDRMVDARRCGFGKKRFRAFVGEQQPRAIEMTAPKINRFFTQCNTMV